MASRYNIYIDTLAGTTVVSDSNSRSSPLPQFVQGDRISMRVYLLGPPASASQENPYSILSNAGMTLSVALGPKTGSSGSTLYTQQLLIAPDSTYTYFDVDLPLNTSGIATLIGTATSAKAWLEFEVTQGGYPWTVFQKEISIQAEVIETGTVATPSGLTAASVEYVNATFLQAQNQGFVLNNPNTGGKVQVYLGDDGTVHFDPIA